MLKNKMLAPPGGWRFYQPQFEGSPTKGWVSSMDLDGLVNRVIELRRKNQQHKWTAPQLTPDAVSAEVQTQICAYLKPASRAHYCQSGVSSFPVPLLPSLPVSHGEGLVAGVKRAAIGIKVLLDWLGDSASTVPTEAATARAAVCVECPQNKGGPFENILHRSAAELVRKQLEVRTQMKLSTPHDASLNVCAACKCPLKLKVYAPLKHILEGLLPEYREKLDPNCWITKEELHETTPQA